jgi:hypothetical protein
VKDQVRDLAGRVLHERELRIDTAQGQGPEPSSDKQHGCPLRRVEPPFKAADYTDYTDSGQAADYTDYTDSGQAADYTDYTDSGQAADYTDYTD